VRYRGGVGINVEVTDALFALTEAQGNQVNAEYDLLNAQANLARALGRYAPPTAGSASPPPPPEAPAAPQAPREEEGR
jgi:outer membrane protein TolC